MSTKNSCGSCGGAFENGVSHNALFVGRICSDCNAEVVRAKVKPYPINPSLRKYELELFAGKIPSPFVSYSIKCEDGFEVCAPLKLTPAGKPPAGLVLAA